MPYTRPEEIVGQTPGMGAGARPVPFTQFLQDSWGTASFLAAPAAAVPFVRLGPIPRGTYAVQFTYGFTGSTAETKDCNLWAMAGASSMSRLTNPTAVNTFLQTTLIITLDGLTELSMIPASTATASTVYSGQITAARIK